MAADPEKKKEPGGHNQTLIGAGIAIGVGVGVAIGSAMGNVGAGMAIGISIGIAVGVALRKKDKSGPDNKKNE